MKVSLVKHKKPFAEERKNFEENYKAKCIIIACIIRCTMTVANNVKFFRAITIVKGLIML